MKKLLLPLTVVFLSVSTALISCTAFAAKYKVQLKDGIFADCQEIDACTSGCMPVDAITYKKLVPSSYEWCTHGTGLDPCIDEQCTYKYYPTSSCTPGQGQYSQEHFSSQRCKIKVPVQPPG